MALTAESIIQLLDLVPHPEGGYYRETYRSSNVIPGTKKHFSTAIYYLLVPGAVSKLHRLTTDEIFHFYLGDPIIWILLFSDGRMVKILMGPLLEHKQQVQMVVPAGTWFGGFLNEGGSFGLMGTTVAPGFEFDDFKLGKKEELLAQFPQAEKEILKLT